MKLHLFLFFCCFFGATLLSCFDEFGNCNPVPEYFTIEGIESFNKRFTNSGFNPWEPIAENRAIRWDEFFIRFEFEKSYTASFNHGFGSELLALDCPPAGYKGSKIGIDALFVRTVYDYDSIYHAGDTINDITLMNNWTFRTSDFNKFYSISEYISENAAGVREDVFEVKLTNPPLNDGLFALEIIYTLQDGASFFHATENIRLIK